MLALITTEAATAGSTADAQSQTVHMTEFCPTPPLVAGGNRFPTIWEGQAPVDCDTVTELAGVLSTTHVGNVPPEMFSGTGTAAATLAAVPGEGDCDCDGDGDGDGAVTTGGPAERKIGRTKRTISVARCIRAPSNSVKALASCPKTFSW
jgi:hypothetical protein